MQDKYFGFKLDANTLQQITEFAKATHRSRAGVVKYAISKLLLGDKNGG